MCALPTNVCLYMIYLRIQNIFPIKYVSYMFTTLLDQYNLALQITKTCAHFYASKHISGYLFRPVTPFTNLD